jgi:hypothetical protein
MAWIIGVLHKNGSIGESSVSKIHSALGFVIMLIPAVIGLNIGKDVSAAEFSLSQTTAQKNEKIVIDAFTKEAESFNRRGPIMIDEDTRMDRQEVGPGARLTYFYSFPNLSSGDIAPREIREKLKSEVKNKICASKEIKEPWQDVATYVYSYSGNDGKEIARFEIKKKDCN